MSKIEHLNITVPNIDEAIKFIQIVAPDFKVRKDVKSSSSYRWAHIGNDEYYFALQEPHLDSDPDSPRKTYKNYGVNHIAIVVDDLLKVESDLVKYGYKRSIETPMEKHRNRLYFFDGFGFEWELIEYSSENFSEKFLYE
ncbi:glyoxalase [Psychromonas sp. MB-3u-54]|uniref:VOC family protein n=1 Tax=Psychromonas sp. MB-3u-54 TaxID=2058319 RepID=UPI000C348896|nr:VOC family protein [Psychromonas sp. MB-3u-54]PKH03144.1 glyoxalase [Psychromonas sp. MB-3u-54]